MAGNNNIFNDKDTMDINELAALNEDISPELIDQLQQKLSADASSLKAEEPVQKEFNEQDDTTLFEEPKTGEENTEETVTVAEPEAAPKPVIDEALNESFEKKYKEKLSKQQSGGISDYSSNETSDTNSSETGEEHKEEKDEQSIEKISEGKILEKTLTPEQKNYNDSLDYLDGNVKYSKYVIYIDPQNVDFIENLTVKERKNLINNILREQDDISITKQRFKVIQTIIRHAIVAILTIAISIPVIYFVINASLEASINNYRRSQSNFQTLYRENGKITNTRR